MQVVFITVTVLVVRGCCVNCENMMGKLGAGCVASVYFVCVLISMNIITITCTINVINTCLLSCLCTISNTTYEIIHNIIH